MTSARALALSLLLAVFLGVLGFACRPQSGADSVILITLGGESPVLDPLAGSLPGPLLAFPAAHAPTNWPLASARLLHGDPGAAPTTVDAWFTPGQQPSEVTLAERFDAAGFRTVSIVAGPLIASTSALEQGFAQVITAPSALDDSLAATRDALGVARRALGGRAFVWIHLRGAALPSSSDSTARTREEWLRWAGEEPDLARAELIETHRAAQAKHRALLAEFLGELRAEEEGGPHVLVTALSGFELLEAGLLGEGTTVREAGLAIPFLLFGPGVPEGTVERRVGLADVGPTLLDLAGLPLEESTRGLTVLPGSAAPERVHLAGTRRLRHADVLYDEQLKLIRDRTTGAVQLYDLEQDPGESVDLHDLRGSERTRMEARLDALLEERGQR